MSRKKHVLGLCGFKCKEDYDEEKQEKALLLFHLIDSVDEQQDGEVKKKLIDLKPALFGIVWSKETKKDFIKKFKKNFNFDCEKIKKFVM